MRWKTEVRALAESLGFRLARTNRHLVYVHPAGGQAVLPSTPGDRGRALWNAESWFRRALPQQREVA